MKMHLGVGGSLRSPEVSGDMVPFRLTDREIRRGVSEGFAHYRFRTSGLSMKPIVHMRLRGRWGWSS
jgi:hypothetical protein